MVIKVVFVLISKLLRDFIFIQQLFDTQLIRYYSKSALRADYFVLL